MRMSSDLQTTRRPDQLAIATGDQLPLFRFRLRQLMWFVTLVCLLLTAVASSSGLIALVLILATLVVSFHLLSTAIGFQLRSHADRSIALHSPPSDRIEFAELREDIQRLAMPRSPWHSHGGIPLPWLLRLVVATSLIGGVLGAIVLTITIDGRTSVPGIVFGSVSIAVVAGWFAFLGYSFYGVFRYGIKQAMSEDRSDQRP
jgi:hypothetical protein